MTTANVLRSRADAAGIADGISAAHWWPARSNVLVSTPAADRRLKPSRSSENRPSTAFCSPKRFFALRASIEEVGDSRNLGLTTTPPMAVIPTAASAVRVVSRDSDLDSRLMWSSLSRSRSLYNFGVARRHFAEERPDWNSHRRRGGSMDPLRHGEIPEHIGAHGRLRRAHGRRLMAGASGVGEGGCSLCDPSLTRSPTNLFFCRRGH
jgi:hypothetical protein